MIGWAVALGAAGAVAYCVRGRSSRVFAPSVYEGPADRLAIALTFDDGPSAATLDLLDLLGRHEARATFFQCGRHVERFPQITREVLTRGHEVGNHTWDHPNFAFKSRAFMREELARTQSVIRDAGGVSPRWFRAPYGVRWPGLGSVQKELGLTGVMWTVLGRDWRLNGKEVAARVASRIAGGGIVCLHDGREMSAAPDVTSTIEATRILLPVLQDRGYRFVTMSDLIWTTT